ncbi:membrane-spanning 4-domains subfamily A member 4D-like [Pelobates cultripes]|uniref:Membrane-spanning 4-domains subfamily A member 4D-like n=1 Tax=Pelobates cultripes TaxID=61616 RepID=A0AAD1WS22_PELCU|nr:membrane-spanning 4-domains subfamily A member 4D-like [Pelobates cultripes]
MTEIRSDKDGSAVITQINPSGNLQELSDHIQNIKNTTPKPLISFSKGEPMVLGVTQIFSGILFIIFGIIFCFLPQYGPYMYFLILNSGLPFWSGVMYIISGSLSISAAVKPTLGKVRSSLVLNIISSIIAGIAIILLSIAMVFQWYRSNIFTCFYYKSSVHCEGNFNPKPVVDGILALLFIMTVSQFCITISTSVFGCKTVCRTSYNETTVIIYQASSVINAGNNMTADPTTLTTDE